MGSIFGGSKSSSSNKAYGTINSAFSPLLNYASKGASGIASLLGGDSSGLNAYKNAVGYDATAKMGSQGITGNAAANGLLRSGSTGKSLTSYGNTLSNQYANDYLSKLGTLAGLGMNAGSLLSNAGSTSTSSQSPNLAGLLGGLLVA